MFRVSIFKSADSVLKNLFSFHEPGDLFTSEDSRRVGKNPLTLYLSYFCMGDPLTAVNKTLDKTRTTYDDKLKEVREIA